VHALCIEGPAFDLLTAMSNFLCLDMPLTDVIRVATSAPADALSRTELGAFKPGLVSNALILSLESCAFDYVVSVGERLNDYNADRPRGRIGNKPPILSQDHGRAHSLRP
jgi:dihydroorotase